MRLTYSGVLYHLCVCVGITNVDMDGPFEQLLNETQKANCIEYGIPQGHPMRTTPIRALETFVLDGRNKFGRLLNSKEIMDDEARGYLWSLVRHFFPLPGMWEQV